VIALLEMKDKNVLKYSTSLSTAQKPKQ